MIKILKKKLKKALEHKFSPITKYFDIKLLELIKLLLFKPKKSKSKIVNLIITSKAELRIFKPLIKYLIINDNKFIVNIFLFKDYKFDKNLVKKINNSKHIYLRKTGYYLCKNTINRNAINVICLDFKFYKKSHRVGIEIMSFLNENKSKTVCMQHGGNQKDNIKGQLSSVSNYQIVYGQIMYKEIIDNDYNKSRVFLTGNPLHDYLKLCSNEIKPLGRKIISVITCLHTEYESYENSTELYYNYIRNIYSSINFDKYILVVKMHPLDSTTNNLYSKAKKDLSISDDDVIIISDNDNSRNVYDVITSSDIIISRSSTIIEESLMMKKKVIAYDLFIDGPSKYYDYLLIYKTYLKVIGKVEVLKKAIETSEQTLCLSSDEINELIFNTTYKLDGNSTRRIIGVFNKIIEDK